jgi:hypothetical protein
MRRGGEGVSVCCGVAVARIIHYLQNLFSEIGCEEGEGRGWEGT